MIHLFAIRRIAVRLLFVATLLVLPPILRADPLVGTPASFDETRAALAHRFIAKDGWRLLYRSELSHDGRFTRILYTDSVRYAGPLDVFARQQEGSLENLTEAQRKYQRIINGDDYKGRNRECHDTLSLEKSPDYAFRPYSLALRGKLSPGCSSTSSTTGYLDFSVILPPVSWDHETSASRDSQSFVSGKVQHASYPIKASALHPVQIKASDFEALVKDFKAKGWIPSAESDTGSPWLVMDGFRSFDNRLSDDDKMFGHVRRAVFARQIASNKACGLVLDWLYMDKVPLREVGARGYEFHSGPEMQKIMDEMKRAGVDPKAMAELATLRSEAEKSLMKMKDQPEPDFPSPMVGTMLVVRSACGTVDTAGMSEASKSSIRDFGLVKKRGNS
ncbi:hypothetical protein ACSSZE_00165 [Acidithiobacillus caldus]